MAMFSAFVLSAAPSAAQNVPRQGRTGPPVSVDLRTIDSWKPPLVRRHRTPATLVAPERIGRKPPRIGERIVLEPPDQVEAAPVAASLVPALQDGRPPAGRPAPPTLAAFPPSPAARETAVAAPPAPALQDGRPPAARPALPTLAAFPPSPAARETARAGTFDPLSRYRLRFAAGSAAVDGSAAAVLDRVAARLEADSSLRLRLVAYAGGAGSSPGESRRLSLARALSVRSRLIDKGVASTRIDVRALGNRSAGETPDRVDIMVGRH